MKQTFLTKKGESRLLLFFAGWGMDETPFRFLQPSGYDCMICYDYRSLDFDTKPLNGYSNIQLVAWSMGVWIASQVMSQHSNLPITKSIAINGTPYPIDETKGISPVIFEGTLQGLNQSTLQKFQRRMCASSDIYKVFQSVAPQRPTEELKEELATIGNLYRDLPKSKFHWTKAIIGDADRIFLPENQQRAWEQQGTEIIHIPEGHFLVDSGKWIVDNDYAVQTRSPLSTINYPLSTKKALIAERFSKAIGTYQQEASVQRQIAGKMVRLVEQHVACHCERIIEFGCGTGIYSRMLLQSMRPEYLLLNDLCKEMRGCCADLLDRNGQVSFLHGDAETVSFPKGTRLITSCSTLQWFESPENFFQRCNNLLEQHGYFAFSTFGKENLKEIRQLTGNGLSYHSREELEASLSPHFQIVHSEEEIIPLNFKAPMEVLYHLKQTGVTGIKGTNNNQRGSNWTRRDIHRFCEQYVRQFSQGSSVTLTYHPIYIIAKKKEV